MRIVVLSVLAAALVSYDGGERRLVQRCPVSVEYSYYDVSGSDAEAVQRSLLANGPKDGAGTPRFALTEWSVAYQWPHGTDWSGPDVEVSLTCTARVLLPRLKPVRGASRELFSAWAEFFERLKVHEENHVRHVAERAPLIERRIDEALAAGRLLSNHKAHRIAASVLAEIRALDREYDQATNHGEVEGAWRIVVSG